VALAAERVFARDGLAEYLRGRGIPYVPFDTLAEIAERLEEQ
jgi:2-hydroxy-3-keto-5-methylthiopentenyl-1-phosphate phosphatase